MRDTANSTSGDGRLGNSRVEHSVRPPRANYLIALLVKDVHDEVSSLDCDASLRNAIRGGSECVDGGLGQP